MIRLPVVWGVARAEARSIRRLVRFWIFGALAGLMGLVSFAYYSVIHGLFSHHTGMLGLLSPKYFFATLGTWHLLIFIVGLVFLGFDIRARDQREGMAEVLDTRPMSNLETLAGRFLGTVLIGWVPVLVLSLLLQLLGWLGQTFGWPAWEVIEPHSLVSFVFLTSIPALCLSVGLVYFVSLAVGNRFASAAIVLSLVAIFLWAFYRVPFFLTEASEAVTIDISELMPRFLTLRGLLLRLGMLVSALGFLGLAASIHPRLDGAGQRLRGLVGAALVLLGLGTAGGVTLERHRAHRRFADWRASHETRRAEPVVTLEGITGVVRIDPGKNLEAAIALEVRAPRGDALETLLFTLNPGLVLQEVRDESGTALGFQHHHGLLQVSLARPLGPGERTRLEMGYQGAPDTRFAYLDSFRDPFSQPTFATQLSLLGFEPGLFHRRYVALMPGIRWLPAAGADVGRDDPVSRPRDFFVLDLEVEVPHGWLVAGPGRRLPADASPGRAAFRFAPRAPLPEVALLASRFEARSTEIQGIRFEVLVHPSHTGNLELFADSSEEIQEWIGERLEQATKVGLGYPYDALTLVEVPLTLRGFAGGWRMDTVLAPPGLLLMRENGFPTSRFEYPLRDPDASAASDGDRVAAKRAMLEQFFANDFSGGSIFHGAARNFFLYQTAARGEAGLPLDFVCHDLTTRLLTEKEGFFSAHLFSPEMTDLTSTVFRNYLSEGGRISWTRALINAATDRPEVWDQALDVALTDIDPWRDPALTVNVLALKGTALSRWTLDGLGWEKTARLLAAVRAHHTGGNFEQADLEAAGREVGADLEALLGDWLRETALPGFVASPARVTRLPDDDNGAPRYQLRFHLRNDEPSPGLVRFRHTAEEGNRSARWDWSDPIRVPPHEAVEMGLVTSKPPLQVTVEPYLALNRVGIPLDVESDVQRSPAATDAEPLMGTRPSHWRPVGYDWIVVDDLDPGFRAEVEETAHGGRLGRLDAAASHDRGLPVFLSGVPPAVWSRWANNTSWGKYRRTLAVIRGGEGEAKAVFTAELPESGDWQLGLHLPRLQGLLATRSWSQGEWDLAVVSSSDNRAVPFDAAAGEEGWNLLGVFDLPAGPVRVELTNRTEGRAVLADAIRWRPVANSGDGAESTGG